jgi:uncharacterized protein YbjT (DUF2867 family)
VPVVVTGADTPLGAAVVAALRGAGVEVRATVRTRVAAASLPPPVAVMDLSDPLRFGAVLEGAHTLVHLDPAPLDHVVEAAEDTSLRRLVLVRPSGGPAADVDEPLEVVLVEGDPLTADPAVVSAVVEADRRR